MTRKLQNALEQQKKDTAKEIPQISGDLGIPLNGQRTVEVPNRNGYVYVRLRSNLNEVIQAFNNQVAPSYNLPVLVERRGNKYVVIGVDTARYENNWGSFAPYLPRHGNTHSFDLESGGGGDIVWVYPRQFMPALVFPSGSVGSGNVIVSPYTLKRDNGTWQYVGNTGTPNITNYRPSSSTGAVMALVYINTDDGNPYLLVGSGTVFSNSITGSSQIVSYIPQVTNPAKQIPLAAVRLITGTSALSWDNIYDVRQFLHNQPTGTAGGGSSSVGVQGIPVQDEGVFVATGSVLNFVGDPVSVSASGSVIRVFVTGSASGGGINTGTLDSLYLRLDTSNDPVVGELLITGSVSLSTPPSDSSVSLYALTRNDNSAWVVEKQYRSSNVITSPFANLLRYPSSTFFPIITAPFIRLYEESVSGTIYGKILHHEADGVERITHHPHATGTIPNYIYDTTRTRPTGTIHTSWRVSGNQVAYLDVSGTFYSNGSPLIKEAPTDGSFYARDSAGWEALSNGQSVLASDINITGTNGAFQEITGISLSLPSAGTYLIFGSVRGAILSTAADFIVAKLHNSTDAADIANSETLVIYQGTVNTIGQNSVSMTARITVNGAKTIKLYAARFFAGTVSISNISSNSAGYTRLSYLRVG